MKKILFTILSVALIITLLGASSVQARPDQVSTGSMRSFSCNDVTDVKPDQCEALVALYDNTNGDEWDNNDGWLDETEVKKWHGVHIDEDKLIYLDLRNNSLSGPIPKELGDLSRLHELELQNNQLSGPIPKQLGQLDLLGKINLSYNVLSGPIPPELGELDNLYDLNLRNNQLSGSIPAQLGDLTLLVFLDLQHNQLSDAIPPALGILEQLQRMYLDNNQLSGAIPKIWVIWRNSKRFL